MKHRWELLPPLEEGGQAVKKCLKCGVRVTTAYGGLCYLWPRRKSWEQSNSPHLVPCPGKRS